MKIKMLSLFLWLLIFPFFLNAQNIKVSFNADIGYARFFKLDNSFAIEKRPFRPCYSMGNRIEYGLPNKNFSLETGLLFQKIRLTYIRTSAEESSRMIGSSLIDGVFERVRNLKVNLIGVPLVLNINLAKSKIKAGFLILHPIQTTIKIDNYFVDQQGNKYDEIISPTVIDQIDSSLYLESMIEYTHQIYKNTWIKVSWFRNIQFVKEVNLNLYPLSRYTIGFNQFLD